MSSTLIIIIVAVLAVLYVIGIYNGFIKRIQQSEEAWSDIDVQLKRRYDLIPNLINTVKGYATHESKVFDQVTAARTAAMGAGNVHDKAAAEDTLSGTLKSLFAVSEAYPDLKANTNFLSLQQELSDTENKIQAARRFYNGTVRDLNIAVQTFPSNIIAGMFNFAKKEFFELSDADAAAKNPVEVKF